MEDGDGSGVGDLQKTLVPCANNSFALRHGFGSYIPYANGLKCMSAICGSIPSCEFIFEEQLDYDSKPQTNNKIKYFSVVLISIEHFL